ncbi:MAG: ABC transporter ATP-binding protein/permease [Coriobacteriia bacterium]|nr:ABC transporter ATP-binding protein/permease [Coriobacteriia bacterium]
MLKLVRYIRPHLFSCLAVLLFVSVQVVCTLELPNQMADIVNVGIIQRGVEGNMQEDPVVAQAVADAITEATASETGTTLTAAQRTYFLHKGSLMLAITLIAGTAAISAGFFASRVSAAIARDLRRDIFAKVESFSLIEFDRFSTASLIIRSTNDIQQVQQMTFFLLRLATMAPLTGVGAIFMALRTNVSLTWILGVVLPILFVIIGVLIYYAMPLFRSIQGKTDRLNLVAREGLTGVRVIRAFNRQDTQQRRFEEVNDDLTDTTVKVNRMMVTMTPIMQLILQFTTIAIIWFGAHLIADLSMQLGDMMAFLQYAMQILFSVVMLSMIFVMYPRASVSAERINDVLEVEPVIEDPVSPVDTAGTTPEVEFRDVAFAFPGSAEPVLRDITFTAKAGEVTAIIGSTGSGKSTILNLIERLYDVTAGTVLVHGIDVQQLSQHRLHELIAYAPQQATLFSGTIAENVRFGKEDATDDEVEQALDIAQATAFVATQSDGIDSPVSQGGANFSGGQKQRIAIARAIVRRPGIYLFDDSFSALDLKTDAKLREALVPELAGSVALIVAQRISTIADADAILVLDGGRIVGHGTHHELLACCKVYQEIAASQLTPEELAEGGDDG